MQGVYQWIPDGGYGFLYADGDVQKGGVFYEIGECSRLNRWRAGLFVLDVLINNFLTD